MDVLCPRCAEPWDNDELHDVPGMTYALASQRFREEGCKVFTGELCEKSDNEMALMARTAYDLLGDDMDGAASMMEDYGLLID